MAGYIIPLVKADTFLYRLSSTDIRRQISKRVVTRFSPIYLSLGNEQARVTLKQHLFDIDCQTDTCNTTQLPTGDPRITYAYQFYTEPQNPLIIPFLTRKTRYNHQQAISTF
ncbi:hypothetical protein L345_08130, partial [Ophiophagus hannah]